MPAALTARRIETIKPGKARREIPDGYLPGLYLVLHPSGHRSWCVRYRHLRRPRKMTIGGYPLFDLKAAREAGAKALRAVAEGRDPGREKTQRPARNDDLVSVVEQFCNCIARATTAQDRGNHRRAAAAARATALAQSRHQRDHAARRA